MEDVETNHTTGPQGMVVPVVGAGSCRSPRCGVRDRHTVGVLKNQTHPRLGALRASGRCCRPGGEVCPGWRSGLGLRTSSPASVSTGGVGGDTRLRRPVPGWEPVGRGVGLLFEIWIVDASIFQTRVCPCFVGGCVVGLIVCCGMPALIVAGVLVLCGMSCFV